MSMQIVEKSGEGLSRVYGVAVPPTELGEKLEARIAEIAPQLNLKGFRPGKVPPAHVRRIYGSALMGEVVEQTLNETSQKVLDDNKLRVASQPDLKPQSDMDEVLAGQEDLAYELDVEVMPDFEPIDVGDPEADAAGLRADRRRKSTRRWPSSPSRAAPTSRATGKTAKAKDGDQVVIDFVGRIDGEAFEGGTAERRAAGAGLGPVHPRLRRAAGRAPRPATRSR